MILLCDFDMLLVTRIIDGNNKSGCMSTCYINPVSCLKKNK